MVVASVFAYFDTSLLKHMVPHVLRLLVVVVVCATRWVKLCQDFCFLENDDIRIRAGMRRKDRGWWTGLLCHSHPY